MEVFRTILEGTRLFRPKVFKDERGFFVESYNKQLLQNSLGLDIDFIQDNHSFSAHKYTIRGMHFQIPPFAQAKLVRVLQGEILDVVVDMREGSPTYMQHESFVLSDENFLQLFIPVGFAHGFCTLKENTHVAYKVDNYYDHPSSKGLMWNDPKLNIQWPTTNPVLSVQDQNWPKI